MTVYDSDSNKLKSLDYTDADIIKTYLIDFEFKNSDYKFLDTLLDNNIPSFWYQEEIIVKVIYL